MSDDQRRPGDDVTKLLAANWDTFVPTIDTATLNEKDRNIAHSIYSYLQLLNSFISDFENDLDLFDFASRHPEREMKWKPIAFRDAALNLWAFRDALQNINTLLERSRSIGTNSRKEALRTAFDLYDIAFPNARNIRHITAHAGGHLAARGRKDNRIGGFLTLHLVWSNRTAKYSHEGKEISFSLERPTIDTLIACRRIVFDSFRDPTHFPHPVN